MKMKKIKLTYLMILVLTISLAACKKEGDVEVTNTENPSKLAFSTTAHSDLNENSCALVTIELRDSAGIAVTPTSSGGTAVAISSGNGNFYSDSACSVAATTINVDAANTSMSFYYNSIKPGLDTVTVSAVSDGLESAEQDQTTTLTFVGTWKNTCRLDDGDYIVDTLVFADDTSMTWTQNLYNGIAPVPAQ